MTHDNLEEDNKYTQIPTSLFIVRTQFFASNASETNIQKADNTAASL